MRAKPGLNGAASGKQPTHELTHELYCPKSHVFYILRLAMPRSGSLIHRRILSRSVVVLFVLAASVLAVVLGVVVSQRSHLPPNDSRS